MSALLEKGSAPADSADEPPLAREARLRRRRRLLLWGMAPVLLALLVAAKLLSMTAFAQQAIWGFDAKESARVASAADGMGVADVIETHKSHFARGDAHVLAGDFASARTEFETALSLTGPEDDCTIRVNLVLTVEKLADAARQAGDTARATKLYEEGTAVVKDAPEGCFQPNSPQNGRGQGERLDEAEERMQEKREQVQQQGQPGQQQPQPGQAQPAEPPAQTPEQQAQEGRLEQLEQKSEAGQQERSEGEQRREYLDSSNEPSVDKPW